MSRNGTVVEVTYEDPRTGERWRERRIEEIADDEVESVRQRELGMVLAPRRGQDQAFYDDGRPDFYRRQDDFFNRPRGLRDDNSFAVAQYPARRTRSLRRPAARRRSPSSSSESSDDSEYRSRRSRRDQRRARSAKPDVARENDDDKDGDDGSNFFERQFDRTCDGLIAAAAGAAIGVSREC